MFRSTSGTVVNAYEPHLASLNDNEPAGRCYSQRSAARSRTHQYEVTLQRSHLSANATNSC
jgi:hypothetical protein